MARLIPTDFNVFDEKLDLSEKYIRDVLKANIENWAKFRFSIYAGNNSEVLISSKLLSNDVKKAFIDLAKSHYEVVNSLGYAKHCLVELYSLNISNIDFHFRIFKEMKEFYIHLCSLLDNLARIIYSLNIKNSATKLRGNKLIRQWIDWQELIKNYELENYNDIFTSQTIQEIFNIRNNMIHNWRPIICLNANNSKLYLFLQIREDRNYLWHYEERSEFINKYKDYKDLFDFLKDDFNFIEDTQNIIFKQLISDLLIFEKNYNLIIKNH